MGTDMRPGYLGARAKLVSESHVTNKKLEVQVGERDAKHNYGRTCSSDDSTC